MFLAGEEVLFVFWNMAVGGSGDFSDALQITCLLTSRPRRRIKTAREQVYPKAPHLPGLMGNLSDVIRVTMSGFR